MQELNFDFQRATPESHLTFYRLQQKILTQSETESAFGWNKAADYVLEKPSRAAFWLKEDSYIYQGGNTNHAPPS